MSPRHHRPGPSPSAAASYPGRPPLLATADPALREGVEALCAELGLGANVTDQAGVVLASWDAAPVVLVGADLLPVLARTRLPARDAVLVLDSAVRDDGRRRRGGSLLTGHDDLWELSRELGAETVVLLPEATDWLGSRLLDCLGVPQPRGPVVAVVGGRGGAGASTLAVSLALVAAELGHRSLLVDSDPWGCGVELSADLDPWLGEDRPDGGLRWPDLSGSTGRLDARTLRSALPSRGGAAVLGWGEDLPAPLPASLVAEVLDAGARGHDLVLVDLARPPWPVADPVLDVAATTLVVVPAEVRAVASTRRLVPTLLRRTHDVRLVVRGPSPGGLSGPLVADAIGLPLALTLDEEPDLDRRLDHGLPPAQDRRSPLARGCRALLPALGLASLRVG